MYLRQRGATTLAKLGGAVKKPKYLHHTFFVSDIFPMIHPFARSVKKSLGKFLSTIKASHGKRVGTTLEVEGEKVFLIMKSNY